MDSIPTRGSLHWTAGLYTPNAIEAKDYHILILPDGNIIKNHNLSTVLAHTYRRNTGTVAISLCGMYGARCNDFGEYPITEAQVNSMIEVCAVISRLKGIHPYKWFTHAEWAIIDNYFPQRWDLAILQPVKEAGSVFRLAAETGRTIRLNIEARYKALEDPCESRFAAEIMLPAREES